MANGKWQMANGKWQKRMTDDELLAEGAQKGALEGELFLHARIGEMLAQRLEGIGFAQQHSRGMAGAERRGVGRECGMVERRARVTGELRGLLAQSIGPPLL